MKLSAVLFFVLSFFGGIILAGELQKAKRYNLLFLMTDEHQAAVLGVGGILL
jgi:hypothetical protein